MYERDMRYDGRRLPFRNARGEFMSRGRGRGRGRRGDRGMDYGEDMARGGDNAGRDYGDMNYSGGRGGSRMGMRDFGESDMRRGDGHYMHGGQSMGGQTYYPIEAMGRFNGYWGMPEQDYGRGRDYGYDMGGDYARGGRRDYGYDYGYPYGDFGETLSTEELHKWQKKLMEQLDEREKQMFRKEAIIPKFKQMGIEMKDFNEEELYTLTIAKYLDHKHTIGQNPDMAIKLAKDAMTDQDAKYEGSEWLCVYFDTFVED